MAFQFPASPVVGQTYTPSAGITFRWNGTAWYLVAGASAPLSQEQADLRYVQIANARSMESRIINGNFAIDQRNAGASVNVSSGISAYGADRWETSVSGGAAGVVMAQRNALGDGGFGLVGKVVTTVASPAAGDYHMQSHKVEGYNIADMKLGTAQAQPFTFACSLYTSIASGTFSISFRGGGLSYVKTFALTMAAGWTPIVMTIPGPTSGTWNVGNGIGMIIDLGLGIGANWRAPAADSWQSGSFMSVAGCTNLMATAGAELWIRDARLYPGAIDYGPCQRLYADELRLCQRYYEKSYDIGVAPGTTSAIAGDYLRRYQGTLGDIGTIYFKTPKRALPQVTFYNESTGAIGTWFDAFNGTHPAMTVPFSRVGESGFSYEAAQTTGTDHLLSGHWTASAEL